MKYSTITTGIFSLCILLSSTISMAAQPVRTITVSPKIDPTSHIQGQQYIVINSTTDNRMFQQIADTSKGIGSSPFDIPVATDLSDKGTLSRAIGWTARGLGQKTPRHYRILLPDDRSIESVIQDSVTAELQGAGYRVVDSSHEKASEASEMNLQIDQFWAWLGASTKPYWTSHEFHAVIEVTLTSDIFPKGSTAVAHGAVTLHGQSPSKKGSWANTTQKALDDFRSNLRELLVAPAPKEPEIQSPETD